MTIYLHTQGPQTAAAVCFHNKVAIFHTVGAGTQNEASWPMSTDNNPVFRDVHLSRLIKLKHVPNM